MYFCNESTKDYSFYPQWAINFDSATHTLSVGRVCITYRKKDSAIMSHWLPSYATSLALIQSANPPSTFSAGFNCPVATNDDVFISSLPLSTQTLYTDSSFHQEQNFSSPSMASAWLALDDDGFILDSSPLSFPSCFPSALRSEIYAIIFGLYALSPGSSVTINTDCAQFITL
ncbi:hypothetical protein RhiirB3_454133 [Rhizophagus irregularis]|nr:hypothetical protein RhiirB3_454133 [Rhizophagus irregularis]